MLILIGGERRVLERVSTRLGEELSAQAPPVFEGTLTELGFVDDLRVLCVDPVPTLSAPASDDVDSEWCTRVDEVIAAACSARRARIVVCTTVRSDHASLVKLRRSGIPYVIVTPTVMVDEDHLGLDAPGRRVRVARDLAVPDRGIVSTKALVEMLVRALTEDEMLGQTLVAGRSGPDAWCELVRELGAEPVSTSPMMARAARMFGAPALTRVPAP